MTERFVRFAELKNRIGLSRSTIWRMERRGEFPARRKIGYGLSSVAWLESEIVKWMQSREKVHSHMAEQK